jgi:hypothetical protein
MAEIKIMLTLEETNLVLEALGEMSFVRVHQLIAKIQQQAQSQLLATQEKQALPKTTAPENLTGDQDER